MKLIVTGRVHRVMWRVDEHDIGHLYIDFFDRYPVLESTSSGPMEHGYSFSKNGKDYATIDLYAENENEREMLERLEYTLQSKDYFQAVFPPSEADGRDGFNPKILYMRDYEDEPEPSIYEKHEGNK